MSVLLSNESKHNLKDSNGIRGIPNGQRLHSKYCNGTVKHGYDNLMISCNFCGLLIGPIHKINGLMVSSIATY